MLLVCRYRPGFCDLRSLDRSGGYKADIGIWSSNQDLTESPTDSGSCPENPVDLTTEMAPNTPVQPELGTHDLASQFAGAMDIDEEETAQIYNDQLVAQRLQEEMYHQEDELLALRFPRRLPAGIDPLGEYREQLQSKRCAKCRAPLKIIVSEVIQRTRKMLKESRRSMATRTSQKTKTD